MKNIEDKMKDKIIEIMMLTSEIKDRKLREKVIKCVLNVKEHSIRIENLLKTIEEDFDSI